MIEQSNSKALFMTVEQFAEYKRKQADMHDRLMAAFPEPRSDKQRIAELEAQLAAVLEAQGKQEPVAWMHWYKYYDGTDVVKVAIGHAPTFNDQSPFRSEPLFAAPVVQPGMVMVPREPTEAMLNSCWRDYPEAARETWRAMISAAEEEGK